jgi:broad specificity phosphatase PhoE
MSIGFVRHARTEWNDAGRMQGRADIGLSEAGRAQVRRWRLPATLARARLVASPLARARETAALMSDGSFDIDDALVEMNWGEWEGQTLATLRARGGAAFEANSARGLDFLPPRGESPRDVQRRIAGWLGSSTALPHDIVAVTHQGVIRTVLALISGWDMTGKPPVRLHDDVVHIVEAAGNGIRATWNVPLVDGPVGRRSAVAALAPRR